MAVGCPLDHPFGGGHLGLAHRRARLDIHDHRIVDVDQVIGGVAEVGAVTVRLSIAGRRIDRRNALGLNRRCAAEKGVVEYGEILLDGTPCRTSAKTLRSLDIGLPVGLGPDQAGIDSKAVTADQSFLNAAPHGGFEQLAEQITLTEASMPVLRKGRVIRHVTVETQAAEPAVSQVEVHLLTQAALRPDAKQYPTMSIRSISSGSIEGRPIAL